MTHQELVDSWINSLPEPCKTVAKQCPPNKLYQIKATGQFGRLYSYSENGTMTIETSDIVGTPYRVLYLRPEDVEVINTGTPPAIPPTQT